MNIYYLTMTCVLVIMLLGCKQESNLSQDVKKSVDIPAETVELKQSTETRFKGERDDIIIPTYQSPSKVVPGRPSIIEGRYSIGEFQLEEACLLFIDSNTQNVGTAILPRGSFLSHAPLLLHIAGEEIALNQQTTVAGVIREDRSLENWSVHPSIPTSCPNSSIIIGVKHDKIK